MGIKLSRDEKGCMRLKKGGQRGRLNKRMLAVGLVVALSAIALSGTQYALAVGDKNQLTHGEDEGYYDVNNCNPFEDDDFPGEDLQNRTGM